MTWNKCKFLSQVVSKGCGVQFEGRCTSCLLQQYDFSFDRDGDGEFCSILHVRCPMQSALAFYWFGSGKRLLERVLVFSCSEWVWLEPWLVEGYQCRGQFCIWLHWVEISDELDSIIKPAFLRYLSIFSKHSCIDNWRSQYTPNSLSFIFVIVWNIYERIWCLSGGCVMATHQSVPAKWLVPKLVRWNMSSTSTMPFLTALGKCSFGWLCRTTFNVTIASLQ